jgi:tellurite resistance protein TehA-like permease
MVDEGKTMGASRGTPAWLQREIAMLYPGCFALVMATGIISNAFFLDGPRAISDALFALSTLAYLWLLAATLVRAARFGHALWADLLNPRSVFAFFTIVAATDVVGVGVHLRGLDGLALALWLVALVLWLGLTYLSFGVLTFLNTPRGADIVEGGWLIAIVGTQSLVVLGTVVAPPLGQMGAGMSLVIHMLWGVGLALYAIFVTLFASRIFFLAFEPADITPLLWVVMGAAAISTNAGAVLIVSDSALPFLRAMRPFIDGVTLIMWAWATWWIPLLVLFGIWKHGIRRVPLTYTPALWSLVFPLGMYAVASWRLSIATQFAPLREIASGMAWVALAVWAATAVGLAAASWRNWRRFEAATS